MDESNLEMPRETAVGDVPMGAYGRVVWITGLAGTGKSTIANALYGRLKAVRPDTILLDGDSLRQVFGGKIGHSEEERRFLAMSYARLCRHLSIQGQIVVCATISLFAECQEWNRRNITDYLEVYVEVPMAILRERDPGGLYSRAANGSLRNVVGLDLGYDVPANPDLVIDNGGSRDDLAARIDMLHKLVAGDSVA